MVNIDFRIGTSKTTLADVWKLIMSENRKHLVASVVRENVETLAQIRRAEKDNRSAKDRVADGITKFSGSMTFVWLHVVWFSIWIALNLGLIPGAVFDPFPFGLLTMIVSLEAIFLSTFVLISQNRAATDTEIRGDLDLQVNLLAERELTKLIRMVDQIGEKLGVAAANDGEAEMLEEQITISEMLEELYRINPELPDKPPTSY